MELQWSDQALSDLERLYAFLAAVNQPAAARTVQALSRAPAILLEKPRIGEQLSQFVPREIRRIFAGSYEIRYEIIDNTVHVLRLWHTREDR